VTKSANDAAVVVAEAIAGSEPEFAPWRGLPCGQLLSLTIDAFSGKIATRSGDIGIPFVSETNSPVLSKRVKPRLGSQGYPKLAVLLMAHNAFGHRPAKETENEAEKAKREEGAQALPAWCGCSGMISVCEQRATSLFNTNLFRLMVSIWKSLSPSWCCQP
jgi:hypothetical protein